ncbi:glucosamine-6-phosphate isomerase [Corynebacterium suranareeae]|uniref:Glucosamine-6-phosphate deaminase n=1 Tax=Corynebacterium suranareeae TaxID=2506452 RepID=A0A160PVZ4_9CORY|nr:glucosamine-6-phosphate deaminase [Corynebacterium suranareeae]BAU96990.1 glucosamine-6-phosphate isomerase [Corynebacterium suranareeae]
MDIIIRKDAQEVGKEAAKLIAPFANNGGTLGLATGSSPLSTYKELIRMYEAGEVSFKECKAFLLDEYVGLTRDDDNSYFKTIRKEFTDHIDIVDERVFSPDGANPDPHAAAAEYEALLAAESVAVQLLGIGGNGHIAFNEPTSSLTGLTKVQALHPKTVEDNARFFNTIDEVPTHALTQGLGTVSRAQNIVLVATGEGKAEAIRGTVEGPVTSSCPGSILQMHNNATIIVDEAAASKLENADYYRLMEQLKLR